MGVLCRVSETVSHTSKSLHLADLEQSLPGNTPGWGSFKACVDFSLWFLMVNSVPWIIIVLFFVFFVLVFFFFCTLGYGSLCLYHQSYRVSLFAFNRCSLSTGIKYGVWNWSRAGILWARLLQLWAWVHFHFSYVFLNMLLFKVGDVYYYSA